MAQSLAEQEHQYFFHTYKRLHLDIVRGEGCTLIDRTGKRYTDFFGGLAVNALGYNHPSINKAITAQIQNYLHLSNFFVQESQVKLAEALIRVSGFERVFFTNSGTEAIEGALKLARKWGAKLGKTQLYGLSNSFHGRTMGALSLTERSKYREGYEPFLPNVGHIRFNDVENLRSRIDRNTLGVVVEVIQGEGGVNVVSPEFVQTLESLRKEHGFLVIADEIQCGIGRTGAFFGFEHFGLHPDIAVIAKAIGGGLPLGAFLGSAKMAEVLTYGSHGTTFGGNPVACAAGLAVLKEVVDSGMMKKAAERGQELKKGFEELKSEFPAVIREVRGLGCMLGVDCMNDAQWIVDELQQRGFLVNCTNATVLRLLPPYTISSEDCQQLIKEVRSILVARLPQ